MRQRLLRAPIPFFRPNYALSRELSTFSSTTKPDILTGKFNYNEAFAAFIRGTQQKQNTAVVIGSFVNELQKNKVLTRNGPPLKVADIGCANATTGLQYLAQIQHSQGFEYYGVDTNEKFLDEAKNLLSNTSMIKDFTLLQNDALSGRLKQIPALSNNPFHLVLASHIGYYLKDEETCKAFLADITNLLAECGIAIFLHESSTYYFRSTYNSRNFNLKDTPTLLTTVARTLPQTYNQFQKIDFTSTLNFSRLNSDMWQAIKDPSAYENFSHNPEFVDNLNKLAFVVQCGLDELHSNGRLAAYIDEIWAALKENNFKMILETQFQTIVRPECALRHRIAKSLQSTSEAIPTLLNKKRLAKTEFFTLPVYYPREKQAPEYFPNEQQNQLSIF